MSSGMVFKTVVVILLATIYYTHALITDETQATKWLEENNELAADAWYEYFDKRWKYQTNITLHNWKTLLKADAVSAEFHRNAYLEANKYDWRNFKDASTKRQFKKMSSLDGPMLPGDEYPELVRISSRISNIYFTARVCNVSNSSQCFNVEPELANVMGNSRDWDTLLWAWKGWRDESGKKMKDDYEKYVVLVNKASQINKFPDRGARWRDMYEMEDLEAEVSRLWEQIKPLYQNLHSYVKRKLKAMYPRRYFPKTGHIPAHILGDMWSQVWTYLYKDVKPFDGKVPLDVTGTMLSQGYNVTTIYKLAEEFYMSLGFDPVPASFWEKSMFVKPKDRNVLCHPLAWNFHKYNDVRISHCGEVTSQHFSVIHHEMGHIYTFLSFNHLPVRFRNSPNPGFDESIGDTLAMSASTPEHLFKVGLLEKVENDTEADLNFLMTRALELIAFMPFGYLVDIWRYSVFRGETTKDNYNRKWWELRCKYQGVSPPVQRSEEDFDPGAKFHIPANYEYMRYYFSAILQYQFHEALCKAAGNTRPLHRCDIYQSKVAGARLKNMLALGSSKPWRDAMEQIAGTRSIDARPMVEYFKPLNDWLTEQNRGHDVTWTDDCPLGSFYEPPPNIVRVG